MLLHSSRLCPRRVRNLLYFDRTGTGQKCPIVDFLSSPVPKSRHSLQTSSEPHDDESLSDDERVQRLGKAYHDEYNTIRSSYRTPKHPIVLCHGLLGFDSMRLGEFESLQIPPLAVIHYWKGIKEALEANGNEVFITRVPRTATVEERAEILAQQIQNKFGGRSINLIGHSMVKHSQCLLNTQIDKPGRHGLSLSHLQHEARLQNTFAYYCCNTTSGKCFC